MRSLPVDEVIARVGVARAFQIAVEIFGRENVIASDASLERLSELRAIGRDEEQLKEYSLKHSPRLVGRAGNALAPIPKFVCSQARNGVECRWDATPLRCVADYEHFWDRLLARFYPDRPLDELTSDALWHGGTGGEESCRSEFDPQEMWEIHVDPYGNVQTCCGIIVGNAHETPLPELMQRGFHTHNELVRMVYERGPYAYLELARVHYAEFAALLPPNRIRCLRRRNESLLKQTRLRACF